MARFVKYYDLSGHWLSEKPQYAYWWMDLIFLACWEKKKFFINGSIIECERGQLAWSQNKLSERWKCSRQNVRTFLNNLEKDSMITQDFIQKSNHKNMIITICNYSEYQDYQPQANHKPTTSQPQTNPIQEIPEYTEVIERERSTKPKNGHKFKEPTLLEVKSYIAENNYSVDAGYFYKYYSEGDWCDREGKPVKNWKQKLITWENKNQGMPQQEKPKPRIII